MEAVSLNRNKSAGHRLDHCEHGVQLALHLKLKHSVVVRPQAQMYTELEASRRMWAKARAIQKASAAAMEETVRLQAPFVQVRVKPKKVATLEAIVVMMVSMAKLEAPPP